MSLLAGIIYSGKSFVEAHPFDTLVSLLEASWRCYLKEEVELGLEAISILAIVQFLELVYSYLFKWRYLKRNCLIRAVLMELPPLV